MAACCRRARGGPSQTIIISIQEEAVPHYELSVRISAYTNQSRVSHSVRMRENSAEEYPKQSSLERSF